MAEQPFPGLLLFSGHLLDCSVLDPPKEVFPLQLQQVSNKFPIKFQVCYP